MNNFKYKMVPAIGVTSGKYFNFLQPDANSYYIDDIATSLSKTCRFRGFNTGFYSVAQHSVAVSHIVPPEDAFAGLLHDAAEAFLGDMPSPLKQLLPSFRALEKRVEQAVFSRYKITLPLSPAIKNADLVMLATERRDLFTQFAHDDWPNLRGIEPLPERIVPLPPEEAYFQFCRRFIELWRMRNQISRARSIALQQ